MGSRKKRPFIFEKGSRPALVIGTLEVLAALVALQLFKGEDPPQRKTRVLVVPTWTDNRGNGAASSRHVHTFPSSALLMELASYMKRMALKVLVEWSHRTGNADADALANGDFSAFDISLRIPVDHRSLNWDILPRALEMGRLAERDSREAGTSGPPPKRSKTQKKRKPEDRLRLEDPWQRTCVIDTRKMNSRVALCSSNHPHHVLDLVRCIR